MTVIPNYRLVRGALDHWVIETDLTSEMAHVLEDFVRDMLEMPDIPEYQISVEFAEAELEKGRMLECAYFRMLSEGDMQWIRKEI